MNKSKSKAAYMISAVAERYEIHPQTLRLYEREGLLAPSRSEGNTRLYTDDDLDRLPAGRREAHLRDPAAPSHDAGANLAEAFKRGFAWRAAVADEEPGLAPLYPFKLH